MLEQVTAPAALPVDPAMLADHLHLATAAPELDETATLQRLITAATTAIERRIDGALIMQTWRWRTSSWREPLPLAPIAGIESIEIIGDDNIASEWTGWFLVHGTPQRIGTRKGQTRPTIPQDGHAAITFTAGFGTGWTDVPADLRQAVTLLAAHYYEHREAATHPLTPLPFGVNSLIAPYRPIRL